MAGSTSTFTVTVLRPSRSGREECVVNASRLVPGDVLVLPPDGCVMPCDAMLLTGSCIVNESMLTGESVPVMKGPPCPSQELYSTEGHKRHTLFSGTHSSLGTIILRTLDIITIVVPPALPAAMTAGVVYSQQRLKKNRIFCVSPPRIIICGKLQVMCFDKTGTLTEDGLDLYAVIPSHQDERFGRCVDDINLLPAKSPVVQALASCHSLTSIQGQLKGDPLDLKMFEFTQWVLEEPGPENTRFHFSSSQQSMGVIARVLGQPSMVYYVKGAPEKIAGMCDALTLPDNFNTVLNEYTSNGFRVIGLAYKKLDRKMKWVDAQRVKRDMLEHGMTFLGFLVMQNSLKPETTQPQQKVVLVTPGLQTLADQRPPLSMEVIGEGGPPKMPLDDYVIAMEGRTWAVVRAHYPEFMPTVLSKGMIFGRFGPDQKTQLITSIQGEGLIVGTEYKMREVVGFGRAMRTQHFVRYLQFYSILGNNQFLYIDLVLTTALALSLGRAGPGPLLTRRTPPVSLVAARSLLLGDNAANSSRVRFSTAVLSLGRSSRIHGSGSDEVCPI
ncbi:unnamed protein product [Leptidea sinapis]|uniref:P-type ATPase A domain-containing protein n=1 Tax=Leptidea sinapis TaxID=189913 RepID=A0A5E4QFJ7_9NEOP|nr:unnamed protein product [Leptidea sinapis]